MMLYDELHGGGELIERLLVGLAKFLITMALGFRNNRPIENRDRHQNQHGNEQLIFNIRIRS